MLFVIFVSLLAVGVYLLIIISSHSVTVQLVIKFEIIHYKRIVILRSPGFVETNMLPCLQ